VKVEVDRLGQPRFEITESVAWDFFAWTPQWQSLAQAADAVCFGSLAQRSENSRATIRTFLRGMRPEALRVFDVNLRQGFYTAQVLAESMKAASLVKLNHEELPKIVRMFGFESHGVDNQGVDNPTFDNHGGEHGGEQDAARRLLLAHDLKLVCVTRGTNGSLLVSANECSEHPGFKVKVADTVGAGDAFTAALVHGYLRGMLLAQINETANRVGAWVATQSGAMPSPGAANFEQTLERIG
jgi:fructokinase